TRRNATRLASCIACQRSRSSAPEVGAPFTGDVDKEPRRTRKTHREPIEFLLRASFVPFVPPCERDQQLSVEYGYLIRTSPLKVLRRSSCAPPVPRSRLWPPGVALVAVRGGSLFSDPLRLLRLTWPRAPAASLTAMSPLKVSASIEPAAPATSM